MTLDVGIHDGIPADDYHADPCETPSLSASVANILVGSSPAHAKAAHPRLNPTVEREEEAKFDVGTSAHALLLQREDNIAVCNYDDHAAIDDYKSTGASADPQKWTRTMYGIGADVQVAFYLRGLEKLTGVRAAWRYAVQETYPPYALSVVDLAPSALALAEAKVQAAIDTWAACLETGVWPAYDRRVASLDVPTWAEMEWLERQELAA